MLESPEFVTILRNKIAYWFPSVPENQRASFSRILINTNIARLQILAGLLIAFMFILILIQLAFVGEVHRPEVTRVAPLVMALRFAFIGGSTAFLILAGLLANREADSFKRILANVFILCNLECFAILSGVIYSAGPGVASSYIMAVLVSATFLHLDWPVSFLVYGLSWAVMGIAVWFFQQDWIIAFSAFLNGSFATVLALIISRVIYAGKVRDFLNRQMIERQKEELAASNDMLKRLSYLDALTGIPNRRLLDEFLYKEWKRALRDQELLSLLMIDIDKFKNYNDTFGHQAGDQVMVQVAAALSRMAKRPCDLVARYGGEEFVAILPDTDPDGACSVAESMRQVVEELNIDHPLSPCGRVTVSIGLACVSPYANGSAGDLISAADIALYQAKESGGNRYEYSGRKDKNAGFGCVEAIKAN